MVNKAQIDKKPVAQDLSRLKAVLNSHNVMGLATLGEDGPHSTPVFYTLAGDEQTLLFMSKTSAQHSQHVIKNSHVSACVYLDARDVRSLHGVQITGVVDSPEGEEQNKLRDFYCVSYPHARIAKFIGKRYRIYALHIETAKLIDNRLGFGRSFFWDFRPTKKEAVVSDNTELLQSFCAL